MKLLKSLMIIVFLTIVIPLKADFLVVSRTAKIHKDHSSGSKVVATVNTGDTLQLLSETQEDGYFKVQVPSTEEEGWIYRTMARRFSGGYSPIHTSTTAAGDLKIRVLDVGAGLCVVACLPDHKYIIYDAGDNKWNVHLTLPAVKKIIPPGSEIEQMILSHDDGDHIYAATDILKTYKIKKIVYTGYDVSNLPGSKESSGTYARMVDAFKSASGTVDVVNLHEQHRNITPGTVNTYGDVKLTYLCGFGEPLTEWNLHDQGEMLNSVSIVVKLTYKNVSVLLTGDAVGRHREDTDQDEIIATERYLFQNAGDYLKSDILVAPHHGGNNGSSMPFITKISPKYVIFSAGHDNQHPTQAAAERYLKLVKPENIFRTDRGDDESDYTGCCPEWNFDRQPGCLDPVGDDDVEINITSTGKYSVKYRQPNMQCE